MVFMKPLLTLIAALLACSLLWAQESPELQAINEPKRYQVVLQNQLAQNQLEQNQLTQDQLEKDIYSEEAPAENAVADSLPLDINDQTIKELKQLLEDNKEMLGDLQRLQKEMGLTPAKIQQAVKELQSNPYAEKTKSILTSQNVRDLFHAAMKKMNYKDFLIAQVIIFVTFLLMRSWLRHQKETWKGRLWVSFYTSFFYFFVASFLVPYTIIGRPWWDLVKTVGLLVYTQSK